MKRHKWKPERRTSNLTVDECIHCGILRSWVGAEYQAWKYIGFGESIVHGGTFKRPDCTRTKPFTGDETK